MPPAAGAATDRPAGELAGSLLLRSAQEPRAVRRHADVLYDERDPPVFDPLVLSRPIGIDKALVVFSVADGSDAIPPESRSLDQVEADGLRAPLPQIEVVLGGARTVREPTTESVWM